VIAENSEKPPPPSTGETDSALASVNPYHIAVLVNRREGFNVEPDDLGKGSDRHTPAEPHEGLPTEHPKLGPNPHPEYGVGAQLRVA
jgi:hypothetical protein